MGLVKANVSCSIAENCYCVDIRSGIRVRGFSSMLGLHGWFLHPLAIIRMSRIDGVDISASLVIDKRWPGSVYNHCSALILRIDCSLDIFPSQ